MTIQPLFPQGKTKALTFSYDDGSVWDKQLVEIFNQYGMKGTFNLSSGWLSAETDEHNPCCNAADLQKIYAGHEIACHGKSHQSLTRSPDMVVLDEILSDRRILEKAAGRIISGMAYAYGAYNQRIMTLLKSCGIVYARTVRTTNGFNIPDNFLQWDPTACHNSPDLQKLADRFLTGTYPFQLCYIWGHSSEFHHDGNWQVIEDFCRKTAHNPAIWYATNMEIYRYVTAVRQLELSANCSIVRNPSGLPVWIRDTEHPEIPVIVAPGEEIQLPISQEKFQRTLQKKR